MCYGKGIVSLTSVLNWLLKTDVKQSFMIEITNYHNYFYTAIVNFLCVMEATVSILSLSANLNSY